METPSAAAAATAAAAAARGARGRSTTKKRHALPLARSSSSRPPDAHADLPPTPTDQMAPSSFAYETPSPSSSRSVRGVRNRYGEAAVQSPEDPDAKGGRSLRRKPRIDYSFDQLVEDSGPFPAKTTPSLSRSVKKRKTDVSFHDGDGEEEHESRVKRRASEQPLSSAAGGSTRRRPAARKTTVEPQMYVPDQLADDAEVQDTIEVGGRHSMSLQSPGESFRARTSSAGSSHHDLTPQAGPPLSSITHPPPPSSPSPATAPITVTATATTTATITPQENESGPGAQVDAAQESAIEDPSTQSSQPPASPEPQVQQEPALTQAGTVTPILVPEAASELSTSVVVQPVPKEEPKPKTASPHSPPQPESQATPEAKLRAQSVAQPQAQAHLEDHVKNQVNDQVQDTVQDTVESNNQPQIEDQAQSLPRLENQAEVPTKDEFEDQDQVQSRSEDQLQSQTQSDPQPQAPSEVKPQSPKKVSPVKEKRAATNSEKKPLSIKEEAKPPSLIISFPIPGIARRSAKDPLGHLTPYIPGATVLFPKIKSTADRDAEVEPEVEVDQEAPPEGEPDAIMDDAAQAGEDGGDDQAEGADEDTPIGTPLALETAANSPGPEPEAAAALASKRQYAFRKTRDASEFTSLFDDVKGLPYTELYYRLEVANRALQAWQSEFNALRLITEDEDNSIRHHQEELAFQHREKMALSKDPAANPLRKDFVVKGTRAPKTEPHLSYLRQQDKVMAQAYLFDYDDRESKIGQQDPVSQRTGAAGKARLRDRPKPTAKAAEADDPAVVSGKRARKAPALFDGMEGASRSSTPAPSSQPKRRRRGAGLDENGELLPPGVDFNGDVVPVVKKGKGGRPRKHPLPTPQFEPTSAPASQEDAPTLPTPNIAERPIRKRRRRDLDEEDEALANGTASEASKKARRRNSRVSEIPTGSFYSLSSAFADEDNRPATSSSTATNTTTASSPNNYSLREKRQKKFSLDDGEYDDIGGGDDDDEGAAGALSRPTKRARRGPRKSYTEQVMPLPDDYGVGDLSQSEQTQGHALKPTPKIKIKNYQPSSATTANAAAATMAPNNGPVSSPYSPAPSQSMDSPTTQTGGSFYSNGHTPQTDAEAEKDYSTMTKSEKMSYSMKARWASGSMSAAVSKRRATLAAKKSARAATPPKTGAAPETLTEAPAAE
ncbi:hypothetical protein MN608_04397 [Microdochium nivale]|nr:hypothetical protein MN608_04397 [Microdochium nivale]